MLGLSPEEWKRLKDLQREYNLRQLKELDKIISLDEIPTPNINHMITETGYEVLKRE